MDENKPCLISLVSASQDEALRKALEKHLAVFANQHHIQIWHQDSIPPGAERQQTREWHLTQASLVLLLISADFFDACETEIAILSGCSSATIIPVLVRPVDLQDTPFQYLQCLPRNGVPIAECPSRDKALQEVAREIREILFSRFLPQEKQGKEKEQKLKAMLADHSEFLRDRLRSFVGRRKELAEIQQRIADTIQVGGYITITGQAGQGKSSIIAKLVEVYGTENVASHFIPFNPGPDHQVGLLRNVMARLILKHNLSDLYVASESRPALRDYFLNMLKELAVKNEPEIIFIDGLDQIEEDLNGVRDLSFLPTSPPKGMVFVLGTRPNDTLKPLELLQPHLEYRLPNMSRSDFDLILAHRGVSLMPRLVDRFYQAMQENALYLDLVAKELQEKGALAPEEMIERIANDPNNLFSLSIMRLKRNPLEWREVIKPILGILLAVREPLLHWHLRQLLPKIDDERLRDGLARLGGLLTITGQKTYVLFHLKLRDYLREDEQNPYKAYVFAKDEEEGYHALLAKWCEQGKLSLIWEETRDPKEQGRRVYARRYYVSHLYHAQLNQQLFAVLDEGSYGKAKERTDRTTRSYIQDLDLGRQAAVRKPGDVNETIALLPALWRYTLLRCSLRSQADQYPRSLLAALLLLRRESDVWGLAELLTDSKAKVSVLLQLGLHFASRSGKQDECRQAFLRAQSVALLIEHAWDKTEALSKIAQALAQTQQWEEAERVARSIESVWNKAEALSKIAQALAQTQQWEEATWVARSIEYTEGRAKALCDLAQILVQAQQLERAEAFLEEAEAVARLVEDARNKVEALSKIAQVLAQAQQLERANVLLEETERVTRPIEDVGDKAEALTEIALALIQIQQWKEGERVARSIEHSWPRAQALRKIAQALALARQWERAERVTGLIEYPGVRVGALSEVAQVLAQAQELKKAERIARSIEEDELYGTRALSEIAQALAQAQQWEQAEAVARSIKNAKGRAMALSDLTPILAQAQQWERAERVARSIEDARNKAEALSEIAQALAQAQQWEKAKVLLEEAEAVARSIGEDELYGTRALSEIAQALAQAQQWERAERVARSIEDAYFRAGALSEVARTLAQAQQWERAERVARSIEDARDKAEALSEIAQALAQAQQWEKAKVLLEEAERVARSMEDAWYRAKALGEIAKILAQVRQRKEAKVLLEEAERVARSMEDAWYRAKALGEIAKVLAQAQQWEQAKRVARSIRDADFRAGALREIAKVLAQAQQWEEAKVLLEEAERVARLIEYPGNKAEALSEIAQILAQAQQWEEVEGVVRSIEYTKGKAEALCEIARILVQAQQWEEAKVFLEEAEKVARSMERPWDEAETLSEVAQVLAQAQQWERAERVARSIEDAEPRIRALRAIAQILVQTQHWEEAKVFLEEAEKVARSMEDTVSISRAWALRGITHVLVQAQQWEGVLNVVQQTWLFAETREYAMRVFLLISDLIVRNPSLESDLIGAFAWVDNFLKGQ